VFLMQTGRSLRDAGQSTPAGQPPARAAA
jgi:hypothetical protein